MSPFTLANHVSERRAMEVKDPDHSSSVQALGPRTAELGKAISSGWTGSIQVGLSLHLVFCASVLIDCYPYCFLIHSCCGFLRRD